MTHKELARKITLRFIEQCKLFPISYPPFSIESDYADTLIHTIEKELEAYSYRKEARI